MTVLLLEESFRDISWHEGGHGLSEHRCWKSDRERKSNPLDWWPTKNHTASLQLRRVIGILSQILLQFFGLIILRISMMSLTHRIVYTTSSFCNKNHLHETFCSTTI